MHSLSEAPTKTKLVSIIYQSISKIKFYYMLKISKITMKTEILLGF